VPHPQVLEGADLNSTPPKTALLNLNPNPALRTCNLKTFKSANIPFSVMLPFLAT